MKKTILVNLVILCCALTASAQKTGHTNLRGIMAAIDSLHRRKPAEKIYMQMDKPYYALGDTLRFKAYVLDEALMASSSSGLLYVELINDSSKVCKRQTLLLISGIAWGDIVIKNTWNPGNYTLRAYTNWLRNFGENYFFSKQLNIIPANNQYWLVNNKLTVDKDKNVNLALQFSDLAHKSIGARNMRLHILQGTSTLFRNKAQTDINGKMDVKFALPEKLSGHPLYLLAEDTVKKTQRKVIVPIQLNRPENTDVQFMPEGGNMIAGIPARIGFKAISENGMGVNISGKIINSKQQEVATFKSAHKGMGLFELIPQTGESYTAKIILGDSIKSYTLPPVITSGISLRVDSKNDDSLEVILHATGDLLNTASPYYIIGQTRDKALYGAGIVFNTAEIHKKIAKNVFPTGVVKFVLFDASNCPVTQRMVFIDRNDLLNINIATNKENYLPRDSIGAQLTVIDATGKPVQGTFSFSVTDNNQVNPFDKDAENIASTLLLNPDIKGNIEDPGYYFNKEHADRLSALDNLLLTQGWTGYDWNQAFAPAVKPEYEAEMEFKVKGRASNIFNKAIPYTPVMLMSLRPQIFMTTQTDKAGLFTFSGLPLLDTINFHIQPGRKFNVGVTIDEFYPPEFTPLNYQPVPWYINSDSTMVSYVNNRQIARDEIYNAGKTKLLQEVQIKGKKYIPPTPPPVLLQFNEEELRNARTGKKPLSLWALLNQKEKLGAMSLQVYVDGRRKPGYGWLYQNNTEDIKGFRAVKIYDDKLPGGVGLQIMISSNTGTGDVISGTEGYAFRPMPISWPHRFYSPRYTAANTAGFMDRRSTIFWEPDMVTDSIGTAKASFYAADIPGTYTLIVEGADMNGNIGYARKKITIGSKPTASK